MYHFNEFYISDHMLESIERYVEHGIPPGSFLEAVICNNLFETVGRADEENTRNLPAFCAYFYNKTPFGCHGSPEKMRAWLEKHQDAAGRELNPKEA